MTTLTLVANESNARMDCVVQGAIGGDLVRVDPDGTETLVRNGQAIVGDSIVWDYECPFGVTVTYRIDDAEETGTLNVSTPRLSHPTDLSLSINCNVVDDDDWTWTAPGTAFDVIGSRWPTVVHSTRTEHRGQLQLWTTWADVNQVHALVETGSPLLLRTPPTTYVDDKWLWPVTVTRSKSEPYDPAWVLWTLDYQRCQRPAGQVTQDPSNSWAAVTLTHTTWATVVTSHSTWVDLVLDAHPHGWVDNMRHAVTLDGVTLS